MNFVSGWREPINQWLALSLICLICFWVVLYYFVNKTEAFGNNIQSAQVTSVKAYTR